MKIKNVSAKVVGVIGKVLLPDEVYECNAAIAENDSVAALIRMGILIVDDAAEKEAAMKEAALAEARAQIMKEMEEAKAAEAAEEKPKTRRGRKPAQNAETVESEVEAE